MSVINLKDRTINAKIVYYGPALGGKTTSLKHVHRVIDPGGTTELVSLNTEKDRTLFFDFLPITLGRIGGFTVRLQAFTVPGQVKYNLTRRFVLTGADAVVLVADARRSQLEENLAALVNLKENLAANALDYRTIPLVLQYNKQDLPDLVPVEELDGWLNDRDVPSYRTVATEGTGVFEAFIDVARRMVDGLAGEYRLRGDGASLGEVLEQNLADLLDGHRARADLGSGLTGGTGLFSRSPCATEPEEDALEGEELLRRAVDSNIEAARLYAEVSEARNRLDERVRELTALNELGRAVTSVLEEDRLLRTVLDSAVGCLDADHGAVSMVSRDGRRLIEKVVRGFLKDPLAEIVERDRGAGLLERAAQGGGLVLSEDAEPELLAGVRQTDARVRSALAAPLLHRDTLVGVVTVYFLDGERAATAEKLRFLSALASHASVALQNARLVSRIEELNRELERKVRDRTARLQRAFEDLRELDRLKDDFLSSISHELITPLTSICSFTEILRAPEGALDPDSAREFLGIIHQEAERLADRVRMLLDVSRIEAGKVVFERRPVPLAELAREIIDAMADAFGRADVRVDLVAPPDLGHVAGDRRWLVRAVENLTGNALKFSPPGSRVELEVREQGREVFLSVTDEGPGIPAELQPVVFERFKQIGEVLTDKPSGIGLGLPLARLIVEGHGGRIWVESRPGWGARFTLALPRPTAEEPPLPGRVSAWADRGPVARN